MNAVVKKATLYRRTIDSLQNFITGFGGATDPLSNTGFVFLAKQKTELDAMYRSDWIARKIIDIPAHDMVRRGRIWHASNKQIEKLEAAEKRLSLWNKLGTAIKLARLYGGAGLVLMDGNQPSKELNPETVRQDQRLALQPFSRHMLRIKNTLITDFANELYGTPEMFVLTGYDGQQYDVHPSRVFPIHGNMAGETGIIDDWWGDSILDAVYTAVQHASLTQQGFASLVESAQTDIVSVKNLADKLATQESTSKLFNRWKYWRESKTLNKVSLFDADNEDFTKHEASFQNQDKLMLAFLIIVSGAADIPAVRMLGQSPSGLNATGESDLRNYYDSINSHQTMDLQPLLDRFDVILQRHALGKLDTKVWYEFTSLWTPTAMETAQIHKLNAEVVDLYAGNMVVNQEALMEGVHNLLVDSGVFPGFEAALAKTAPTNPLSSLLEEDLPDKEDDLDTDAGSDDDEFDDESSDDTGNSTDEETAADEAWRKKKRIVKDAMPRTLYVRRQVKNAKEIIKWAREQGFETTQSPSDLHVTIAYSRQLIDWMTINPAYEDEIKVLGGPRLVEPLGPKGAVVLFFNTPSLKWRWLEFKERGCSWDWDKYQPHITITYDKGSVDLRTVEPYRGPIFLGPEIFEEIVEEWMPKLIRRRP